LNKVPAPTCVSEDQFASAVCQKKRLKRWTMVQL